MFYHIWNDESNDWNMRSQQKGIQLQPIQEKGDGTIFASENQLIVFIKNKIFHLFKIEKVTMSTYCINVFCSCPSKLCHRMLCIKWSPASINFCKRITKSKLLRHLVKTVYSSTIYHSYWWKLKMYKISLRVQIQRNRDIRL